LLLAEAVDARVYVPMTAVLPRQRAPQVSPWTSRAAAEATEAMAVDSAPGGRAG
ncbi:serine/threonine protein kinase, partial [Micromonospora provocatoris]